MSFIKIKVKNEQVKPFEGKGEMIKIREEYLPLIRLHKVFEIDTQVENIEDGNIITYYAKAFFIKEDNIWKIINEKRETSYKK